ncbi:hypothetical protein J7432_03250 [Xanthomonas axonopodis pv. begoniae]|uniref:hypothetical protein n=1 Tax=Xanthomonas phaseoli TaxID=1985254 RepID=UPI000CEF2EB0|nr:hypothetical protein [Xanthomonas phaseoli]MBO9738060.1 hypothetical protein [Xanthomonas axonopodis pv. begoniae]MBO9771050.1 hypothetical protein [Xanthomonas axonopodis pv. begoniae]MCC8471571.1 hypothetical protein [Xanthomonas phaseoli]PPT38942.1 hypothetical protein XabCFBP2524_05540 [Xanthomonas axonopodis pv. begoniae]
MHTLVHLTTARALYTHSQRKILRDGADPAAYSAFAAHVVQLKLRETLAATPFPEVKKLARIVRNH